MNSVDELNNALDRYIKIYDTVNPFLLRIAVNQSPRPSYEFGERYVDTKQENYFVDNHVYRGLISADLLPPFFIFPGTHREYFSRAMESLIGEGLVSRGDLVPPNVESEALNFIFLSIRIPDVWIGMKKINKLGYRDKHALVQKINKDFSSNLNEFLEWLAVEQENDLSESFLNTSSN